MLEDFWEGGGSKVVELACRFVCHIDGIVTALPFLFGRAWLTGRVDRKIAGGLLGKDKVIHQSSGIAGEMQGVSEAPIKPAVQSGAEHHCAGNEDKSSCEEKG